MPLPLMIESPIVFRGEQYHVRFDDQELVSLSHGNGTPVVSFVPGWQPTRLYTGFAPVYLLEFESTAGECATWFLDQTMRRNGDQLDQLPAEMLQTLIEKATPLLQKLLSTILCDSVPQPDLPARTFLRLNSAIRAQIVARCAKGLWPEPSRIDLTGVQTPIVLESARSNRRLSLSPDAITAGLAEHFQMKLLRAMAEGVMTWPSPIDAAPCPCGGGFFLSDFQFAYRFYDEKADLVFYVPVSQHHAWAFSLYIPAFDHVIGYPLGLHLTDVFFRNIASVLSAHALHNTTALALAFGAPPTRFVTLMRGHPSVHIGHQLWNELTGLEKACTELSPERMPEVVVLGSNHGTELYGRVDELFPPLSGFVNRTVNTVQDLIGYAYRERLFLCRMTQEHITTPLRNRIMQRTQASGVHAAVTGRVLGADGRQRPVIVLGLRVENRTLVDLVSFFCDVLNTIATTLPGAFVVLDGHNARDGAAPGDMISSHMEHIAARSPAVVEQEVAKALEAHAQRLPLTVVNNIGASVVSSLAWCDIAIGFIAIWGAGLAKYRWAANLPGYILSSRANLTQRNDFDIYNVPQYIDDPAPVVKADPELVFDRPDMPLLIPVDKGPLYANFTVDEVGIQQQVANLLAAWGQKIGWTEPPPLEPATRETLIPQPLPLTDPCRFAVCLIVRNEVHDLAEWLLHYYNIGFERFYIYDHKSNDGTTALIGWMQNYLPIIYIPWTDTAAEHPQVAAYNDCLKRTRSLCEWVLFVDSDEFLIPPDTNTLIDSLVARCGQYNAMALNWLMYGSSGLADTNGRLVLESFTSHASFDFAPSRHVKCLIRPEATHHCVNPHYFAVSGGYCDVNGRPIAEWMVPGVVQPEGAVYSDWRLHHYFIRSRAHWERRLQRKRWSDPAGNRTEKDFKSYDRNDIFDDRAVPFAARVREQIEMLESMP